MHLWGFSSCVFFSLHLDAADASSPATVPTLVSCIRIIADGIKAQNSSNAVTYKTHLKKRFFFLRCSECFQKRQKASQYCRRVSLTSSSCYWFLHFDLYCSYFFLLSFITRNMPYAKIICARNYFDEWELICSTYNIKSKKAISDLMNLEYKFTEETNILEERSTQGACQDI